MSTFNAPAGRSFRASNTEAGSMMLRGSRSKSLYMDCAGRTWLLDLFPPPTGCSHDIIVTPYDITTLDLAAAVSIRLQVSRQQADIRRRCRRRRSLTRWNCREQACPIRADRKSVVCAHAGLLAG